MWLTLQWGGNEQQEYTTEQHWAKYTTHILFLIKKEIKQPIVRMSKRFEKKPLKIYLDIKIYETTLHDNAHIFKRSRRSFNW